MNSMVKPGRIWRITGKPYGHFAIEWPKLWAFRVLLVNPIEITDSARKAPPSENIHSPQKTHLLRFKGHFGGQGEERTVMIPTMRQFGFNYTYASLDDGEMLLMPLSKWNIFRSSMTGLFFPILYR